MRGKGGESGGEGKWGEEGCLVVLFSGGRGNRVGVKIWVG